MGRWVTHLLAPANEYRLVSKLFVRLLGAIFLAAFISLGVQIVGLAGANGVIPLAPDLAHAATELSLLERVFRIPTVFWFNSSDAALHGVCIAGGLASVFLMLGLWPRLMTLACYALYLSLFHAAPLFMTYQWDVLLLESAVLALPLAGRGAPPLLAVWMLRWLLFRLRFMSGLSKLASGDPSWLDFSAVRHYFETQPLPHVGSWYAFHLPESVLRAATPAALALELVVPFMMVLPRRPRLVAAGLTATMQILIVATSNHNFFNLLSLALCLFLIDDRILKPNGKAPPTVRVSGPVKGLTLILAALVFPIGAVYVGEMLILGRVGPGPASIAAGNWQQAFFLVNRYHVFPTMKRERIEVIVEGSQDGATWLPYEFRYKPGDPMRRPPFAIPHQPRLDWMMWFVPMGHPGNLRAFAGFMASLARGSPDVIALLANNPFPAGPPRFLRASVMRYRFTSPETRRATGRWWDRDFIGPFPHP